MAARILGWEAGMTLSKDREEDLDKAVSFKACFHPCHTS